MTDMPHASDTPGRLLATARVRAGLTLGDVAARSKVPIAALQAIDQDDYRRIGAPVYARGFVRLYAREVGLDPALPIALLEHALAEAMVTAPTEPRASEAPARRAPGRRSRAIYSLAAVALLAVVLLVLFSATQGPTASPELRPDAASSAPVVVPLPVEVIGAPTEPAAGEAPADTPAAAPPTERPPAFEPPAE